MFANSADSINKIHFPSLPVLGCGISQVRQTSDNVIYFLLV